MVGQHQRRGDAEGCLVLERPRQQRDDRRRTDVHAAMEQGPGQRSSSHVAERDLGAWRVDDRCT